MSDHNNIFVCVCVCVFHVYIGITMMLLISRENEIEMIGANKETTEKQKAIKTTIERSKR